MFVGDLGYLISFTAIKHAYGGSSPDQNLAFETLSYGLGGIIHRHNLELDTKAWHASVAELWLDDVPRLSYLVTN